MDSVNQQKLLASFQRMQIAYMESMIAENELSGDELFCVIHGMREKIYGGK